jgi:hypothetical protein
MTDTLRIKRRPAGGAAGAPTSLSSSEIAFNEVDDTLWYGKGDSGGLATSIIPIAGAGAFPALGDGRWVKKAGDTMVGGLSFGQQTSPGDVATNVSRHISLYDGFGGFSITPGTMNVVSGGDLSLFGGWNKGLTLNGTTLWSYVPISLPSPNPTDGLHAAHRNYVDGAVTRAGGPFLALAGGSMLGQLNITNNTNFVLKDASGGDVRFVVGSDNHFGLYSTNAAGATAITVWDFYARTDSPTQTFRLRTYFSQMTHHDGGLAWPTAGGDFRQGSLYADANWGGLFRGFAGNMADLGLADRDGNIMLRIRQGWIEFTEAVSVTNTAVTLTLSKDPTEDMHAVTRRYATTNFAPIVSGGYLALTGGAMTGAIQFNASGNNNYIGQGADGVGAVNNNIKISSWWGVGFYNNVGVGSVPGGQAGIWFDTREGNATFRNVSTTGLYVGGDSTTHNIYHDGSVGIMYRGVAGADWFAFKWDGTYSHIIVNGGDQGTLATQAWTNTNFAASGALGSYVAKAGDVMSGGLRINYTPTNTSAQLWLSPNSGNAGASIIRFNGTFAAPQPDTGPRYATSIRSGQSTTGWGGEYLDVWITDQVNDVNSDARQTRAARFTLGQTTFDTPVVINRNLFVNGAAGDPVSISAPNGSWGRYFSTVVGTRTWAAGTSYYGAYVISDENVPAVRFQIGTDGNADVAQGLTVGANLNIPNGGINLINGVSTGSAQNSTRGITFWGPVTGPNYGIVVTGNTLNYNTDNTLGAHDFYSGGGSVLFRIKGGDRVTSNLPIFARNNIQIDGTAGASVGLTLNNGGGGGVNDILGYNNSSLRWIMRLGGANDQTGDPITGTGGSAFALFAYRNDGNFLGQPFYITRSATGGDTTINGYGYVANSPNGANGIVNLGYLQANYISATAGDARWVNQSGDEITGQLVVTGTTFANGRFLFNDQMGHVPVPSAGAGYLGWNVSNGWGEVNFVNGCYWAPAGFDWKQVTGEGTWKTLMTMRNDGHLHMYGYGVGYDGLTGGGNIIGFTWTGSVIRAFVDGGSGIGDLATQGWAGGQFLNKTTGGTVTGTTTFTPDIGIDSAPARLWISASFGGGWNPIVTAGDTTIFARRDAGADLGALTLMTWSNSALGIRIDGASHTIGMHAASGININNTLTVNASARVFTGDGIPLVVSGATKGVRFLVDGTAMAIEGVDNTGTASYQPLRIGGSSVTLTAPVTVQSGQSFTLGKDPANAMEAVTRQYLEANAVTLTAGDARWINVNGDAMAGGLGFGAANVGPLDVTRHIRLYDGGVPNNQYGFSVSWDGVATARLNYVVTEPGHTYHAFWVGSSNVLEIGPTETKVYNQLTATGNLSVSGGINLNNGVSGPQNSSRGITFWGSPTGPNYSIVVSGSTLNYNVNNTNDKHDFYSGGVLRLTVTDSIVSSVPVTVNNGVQVNGQLSTGGWLRAAYNTNITPPPDGAGLISWNRSQGEGEVNFYNGWNGSGRIFDWRQVTGVGTEKTLMHLNTTGSLTLAGTLEVMPPTGQFFVQNGAKVTRIADRLFVGPATANDGRYPNVSKDWLQAFLITPNGGSIVGPMVGTMMSVLSSNGQFGFVSGSRSSDNDTPPASENTIGIGSFAINDNTTTFRTVYAYYGEGRRLQGVNGVTFGLELDVSNQDSLVSPTPYGQLPGQTVGIQMASGCGVTLPNANDTSIGIAFQSNPTKFCTGILFGATSIRGTDGNTGAGDAIAFAKGHTLTWYSPGGQQTAKIQCQIEDPALSMNLIFDNNGVNFTRIPGGVPLVNIPPVANPANWLVLVGAPAGGAVGIVAGGGDTNINLALHPKGTGVPDMKSQATVGANAGSAAALPANPSGYMVLILNGAIVKIPYYNP